MDKKDDNVEENTDIQDLEKILNEADFSVGHKESVWEKIMSQLHTPNEKAMEEENCKSYIYTPTFSNIHKHDDCLSEEELDNVAGGLQKPPEDNGKNGKPKKGGI